MSGQQRLDEQFPIRTEEPVAPTLRRLIRAIEIRFRALEDQRAEYDAAIKQLQQLGLDRINDLLLPASEQIVAYTTLGWLLVRSASEVTLAADANALFIVDEGPQRELFIPTPFLAIQREDDPSVFAIALKDTYHRESGSLLVKILAVFGDPGPHNDWVITAAPGVSEATRSYLERAFEAAQDAGSQAEVAADQAASAAEDRAYVQQALDAFQEAGLNPDAYAWRDGTRPFTAVQPGVTPDADADGNELLTAEWARARQAESLEMWLPSYGSPHAQIIQPLPGSRRGLLLKGQTHIKLDVPDQPGRYVVWSLPGDLTIPNVEALLDTGTNFLSGRDYCVYLVLAPDNETASFKVSLNTTAPDGATIDNSRKIGGFHTLCVSAGSGRTYVRGGQTVDFDLNGWLAGDILPLSIWDLKHRPHQDRTPNPGITREKYLDFWLDIYRQSGTGPNTTSAYQGTIVHTREYVDHVEDMLCVGKTLLSDEEYAAAALGSPEQVNVQGGDQASAQNGGAGGRIATNGQRILSYCGCEEMVGCMWEWLRTTSAAGGVGAMAGRLADGSYNWFGSNPWGATGLPAHLNEPRPQAGGKGGFWGLPGALRAGGGWGNGAGCGSRARIANDARSSANANFGARGREPSR